MVDLTELGVRGVEEAVKALRSDLDKGWTERELTFAKEMTAALYEELEHREQKHRAEATALRKDLDHALNQVEALRKALDDSLGQVKALLKALPAPQVQVKNIVPTAPPADVVVHNHVPEVVPADVVVHNHVPEAKAQVDVHVPPRGPVVKSFEYDDYGRPARIYETEQKE